MKHILRKVAKRFLCLAIGLFFLGMKTYASEGEDVQYVTISVDAADENGKITYALDTDTPSAFTEANEFSVPAGTSHTIYVKDEAGNITSQRYEADEVKNETADYAVSGSQISIDLEIDASEEEGKDSYEYLTDTPLEGGQGTVSEKKTTDGSDTGTKVFYTITTTEGEVFYMVIDQSQSADNVYLLRAVTKDDLKGLAVSGEDEEESESLLQSLNFNYEEEMTEEKGMETKRGNSIGDWIIYILIFAFIGCGYYYLKIYKPKKAVEMELNDAMDIDEFGTEDEEEVEGDSDGYTFSELQEEKKKMLEEIMKEDDNTDRESIEDE